MPKQQAEQQPWKVRFVDITQHVGVECAFVFIGEDAEKVRAALKWPDSHRHFKGPRTIVVGSDDPNGEESGEESGEEKLLSPTLKIYLFGYSSGPASQRVSFRLLDLDNQLDALGIRESHIHWTFMRRNARIACAPRSQGKELWGFGREHEFKPHFKPHQDLAGPLVDYRPGAKEGWKFEPVLVKIKPDASAVGEHYLELTPEWEDGFVAMKALTCLPSQVSPLLAEYKFRLRGDPREELDRADYEELREHYQHRGRFGHARTR